MNSYIKIICFIVNVFSYFSVVTTVAPRFCQEPLNRSDCGVKPTPVVTYWKPGSRCEVDEWRGCPTYNKFENEYECSMLCIFRMTIPIEEMPEPEVVVNECEATFNDSKCNDLEKTVYTYTHGECVQKTWRGCKTRNKFEDEAECANTCVEGGWKEQLEEMTVEELKVIEDIVEEIAKTEPPTTEAITDETTTEEETEEPTLETTTPEESVETTTAPSSYEETEEEEEEAEGEHDTISIA